LNCHRKTNCLMGSTREYLSDAGSNGAKPNTLEKRERAF
jgi:hypothetical protein